MTVSRLSLLLVVASVINAQDIIYESEDDTCRLPDGGNGICKDHRLCPEVIKNLHQERPVNCGFVGRNPIVCCPVKIDRVTDNPVLVPILDISPPTVDFKCGDSTLSEVKVFSFGNARSSSSGSPVASRARDTPAIASFPENSGGLIPPGLLQVNRLFGDDPNRNGFPAAAAVGGVRARRVLAKYTALIGSTDPSGLNDWFCTGVLLNHQWVLTAAHCRQRAITVVRLGEHDHQNPNDGAVPLDFRVLENIPYPDYSSPQGYHDLALLKLSSFATFGPTINPVCLPWGDASNTDLTNTKITLTGWGATQFGGKGSSILQEVDVTVFSNSVCERTYSGLKDYNIVWPQGMKGKDVLCAGGPEGGKDACQGDSGGPVTYLNTAKQYVLAGVVSRGYGCGLKDFPGLYANMHYGTYLAWIREVAFQ